MFREFIHYALHLGLPLLVASWFFPGKKWAVFLLLLAGMAIDLDHLWADPVFDPNRCSIGFHPLHSYGAIAVYITLLFFRRTRLAGLALVIHIAADMADCMLLSFEA